MAAAIAARPFAPTPSHSPLPITRPSQPHPHKHMPYCPPGPRPAPSRLDAAAATAVCAATSSPQLPAISSLTHPPDSFSQLHADPTVFAISATQLEEALEHLASQPLPDTQHVFPWLHGLHADNHVQLAFFLARKKAIRRAPRCLRGIAIIKAGGDLSHSKLRGAIAPEELLKPCSPQLVKRYRGSNAGSGTNASDDSPCFHDIDPRAGFGVRNFQIQACKMATVSDIVVYGDLTTPRVEIEALALRLSQAQSAWQRSMDARYGTTAGDRLYNTFVLSDNFDCVEAEHPELVALDSEGCMTGRVLDFFHRERVEMYSMSAPGEISHNVWLGPTPDPALGIPSNHPSFDIMIEASDLAELPDSRAFNQMDDILEHKESLGVDKSLIPQLEFPSSGAILPPTWLQDDVDGLLNTVEWIHGQANACRPARRRRRDSKLSLSPSPEHAEGQSGSDGRKILIHCGDGYTESSLLALAYYMYAERVPAHEAWLALHRERGRNFFAYATDLALLRAIQPRILQMSPKRANGMEVDPLEDLEQRLCPTAPAWLDKMDGSLPSRILDYMYLGNLGHANNPGLLRELGVGQILSVGEPLAWTQEEVDSWPAERLMFVDRVQDNGVDPLINEFGRCLEFIENGRKNGTSTLVHCRVGVSRSATICIAEVMNELGLSFPRAYCFVRARRLNVIIQPHLRFCYELLQWEEAQCKKRHRPVRRELEWACIAREIASMNKPYARQQK